MDTVKPLRCQHWNIGIVDDKMVFKPLMTLPQCRQKIQGNLGSKIKFFTYRVNTFYMPFLNLNSPFSVGCGGRGAEAIILNKHF